MFGSLTFVRVLVGVMLAVVLAASLPGGAPPAHALFHLMRVYAVGAGGVGGGPTIQYVELRMTNPGQTLVSSHVICFFDSTGNPWARFQFPTNVGNGADEASILVGTSDFDFAWTAGSPDFTFTAANTTFIAAGASAARLIDSSGKVAFGSDSETTPALMCSGSFSVIDSVAYGSAYPSGAVDYPPKEGNNLTPGTALRLVTALCHPDAGLPCPRANDTDYSPATNFSPRNNANQSGPIDGDRDDDGWANPAEGVIGTDPLDNCADNIADNAWPPDINNDASITGFDLNAIAQFSGAFVPPAPARRDIAPDPPDGAITGGDLNAVASRSGRSCVP